MHKLLVVSSNDPLLFTYFFIATRYILPMAWYTIYSFQVKAFNFILCEESRYFSLFQVLRERERERERERHEDRRIKKPRTVMRNIYNRISHCTGTLHSLVYFFFFFFFFFFCKREINRWQTDDFHDARSLKLAEVNGIDSHQTGSDAKTEWRKWNWIVTYAVMIGIPCTFTCIRN